MKQLLALCVIISGLTLNSCESPQKKPGAARIPTADSNTQVRPAIPYPVLIKNTRQQLRHLQAAKKADSIQLLLYKIIAQQMPVYWKGTRWDFNGVSRIPGDGAIACGYFITTILDDIGLKINRVRMAQVPSSQLIEATCKDIKKYGNIESLKQYLKGAPDNSILLIGLDFHTGFLIKDAKETYFFHSNYIKKAGVVKEPINASRALASSKSFMVGMLSRNDNYILR